jgi:hypothetical protein
VKACVKFDPVVDSRTPMLGSVGSVEDRARLLPLVVDVEKAKRRDVEKPVKPEDVDVENRGVPGGGILHKDLV